jgi:large subunit ribosomal protein L25
MIPAELYGREMANVHLSVPAGDFADVFRKAGENSLVELDVEGSKYPVLIYDVVHHPLSGEVLAVDFYGVRLDEEVQTEVPLVFVGQAPAVEDHEGVLIEVLQTVAVESLPADIPREIKVDVSHLTELEQSIHVKDLAVPRNVRILVDPEAVVVTVKPQMTEEEEKALEEENAQIGAEPEEAAAESAAPAKTDESAGAESSGEAGQEDSAAGAAKEKKRE